MKPSVRKGDKVGTGPGGGNAHANLGNNRGINNEQDGMSGANVHLAGSNKLNPKLNAGGKGRGNQEAPKKNDNPHGQGKAET